MLYVTIYQAFERFLKMLYNYIRKVILHLALLKYQQATRVKNN
jgi:hypothetical protein